MGKKVTAKLTEERTEQTIKRTIELPTEAAETLTTIIIPDRGRFGRPFVTVFKDALLYIVKYGKLTKNELYLLCYLIASTSADNMIITDLLQISQELGMDKGNVCRALNGLIKRNIVIKKATRKNYREPTTMGLEVNFDQLNYNLAYNGKVKAYAQHKIEHPALTDTEGHLLTDIAHAHGSIAENLGGSGGQSPLIPGDASPSPN